jgi:ABC-type branched-subunit amino acid transport system substrate-binding protein
MLLGMRTRLWAAEPLRLALMLGPGAASLASAQGVTLGAEEASRTGALIGRSMEIQRLADLAEAERWARSPGAGALIGGSDDGSAAALGDLAAAAGILFVNLGARADALRGADCRASTFHVEASEAMYRDAARAGGNSAGAAVLWDAGLERFGAGQLNDRYRARFGGAMDGAAWAGWIAVKALWEASLRSSSSDPGQIRAYLERDATQLDGHKGWPLSFRGWDHQLRQPLYLVADGRVVSEVPERTGEEGSSRELLDRLGVGPAASTCNLHGGSR